MLFSFHIQRLSHSSGQENSEGSEPERTGQQEEMGGGAHSNQEGSPWRKYVQEKREQKTLWLSFILNIQTLHQKEMQRKYDKS